MRSWRTHESLDCPDIHAAPSKGGPERVAQVIHRDWLQPSFLDCELGKASRIGFSAIQGRGGQALCDLLLDRVREQHLDGITSCRIQITGEQGPTVK